MTERNDQFEADLSAYLDAELTPERAAEVERWLAQSPDARATLESLRAVHNRLSALPRHRAPADLADALARHAERRLLFDDHAPQPRLVWIKFAGRLTAAAAVLVACVLVGYQVLRPTPPAFQPTPPAAAQRSSAKSDVPQVATATRAPHGEVGPRAPAAIPDQDGLADSAELVRAAEPRAEPGMIVAAAPAPPGATGSPASEDPSVGRYLSFPSYSEPLVTISVQTATETEFSVQSALLTAWFLVDQQRPSSAAPPASDTPAFARLPDALRAAEYTTDVDAPTLATRVAYIVSITPRDQVRFGVEAGLAEENAEVMIEIAAALQPPAPPPLEAAEESVLAQRDQADEAEAGRYAFVRPEMPRLLREEDAASPKGKALSEDAAPRRGRVTEEELRARILRKIEAARDAPDQHPVIVDTAAEDTSGGGRGGEPRAAAPAPATTPASPAAPCPVTALTETPRRSLGRDFAGLLLRGIMHLVEPPPTDSTAPGSADADRPVTLRIIVLPPPNDAPTSRPTPTTSR